MNNQPQPQHPQRQPGQLAGFLLGMNAMPAPRPEEYAAALAIGALDRGIPNGNLEEDAPPPPTVTADRITVRAPISPNCTTDIDFPFDIPRPDFFSRVYATMNLSPQTDKLGWKTSDEGKRSPAHRLLQDTDVDDAFDAIRVIKANPRRQKAIWLEITHLNPPAPPPKSKKTDGDSITDFAYGKELRIVKEKLRCAVHAGPNRWCWVDPDDPRRHLAIGTEEVTLWARKMHDNEADNQCAFPPACLNLAGLKAATIRPRGSNSNKVEPAQSALPPIHFHLNNPLNDHPTNTPPFTRKHSHPSTVSDDGSESETEPVLITDVLARLHEMYPKTNYPQYAGILETRGIAYAEQALDMDRRYYADLGMTDGAIGPFLRWVKKLAQRARKPVRARGSKRARRSHSSDKEN